MDCLETILPSDELQTLHIQPAALKSLANKQISWVDFIEYRKFKIIRLHCSLIIFEVIITSVQQILVWFIGKAVTFSMVVRFGYYGWLDNPVFIAALKSYSISSDYYIVDFADRVLKIYE